MMYKFLVILIAFLIVLPANGYLLGFKSGDREISGIAQLEYKYPEAKLPMVSLIFDPWGEDAKFHISTLSERLGKDRIYHLTISPNPYTAQQVADGYFDEQYRWFFEEVKRQDLMVVFRTMHEMNGGWYMWSSDPDSFRVAWRRVRELSREVGLDQSNILFSLSHNAWDLPRDFRKHYEAYQFCYPAQAEELNCPSAEDYYPGDEYVDLMGVTFYNRGKGNSNRIWQSPRTIVASVPRNTLQRLQTRGKPIFIDEVGTTAVWYAEGYNYERSRQVYENEYGLKNEWLLQLRDMLYEEQIVGAIYFNIDLTDGLHKVIPGELDRSAINIYQDKQYFAIWDLIAGAEKFQNSRLLSMFGRMGVDIGDSYVIVKDEDRGIAHLIARVLSMVGRDGGIDAQIFILQTLHTRIQDNIIDEQQKNRRLAVVEKFDLVVKGG